MNIAQLIQKNSQEFPKDRAFIFNDNPVSFSQLKDTVFALARGLEKLGIGPQDKVGIYLPNWPQYLYSYLALFCLGATVVPLDYMFTEEEIASCLNHCEAKFLIAKAKEITSLGRLKSDVKTLETIITLDRKQEGFVYPPSLRSNVGASADFATAMAAGLNFDALLHSADTTFEPRDIADDDLSLIMYTSGTTGKPKGIMLTYKHLSASVMATDHVVGWKHSDILACAVPFSHIAGLMSPLISTFHGVGLILMERFIPLRFLQAVSQYKVSCFYLVPSMYYAILHLKEFEMLDLSSVRFVNVFGAPNTPEVLRRFHRYCLNASFLNGWGLTETNGPCAITPLGEEKLESVGKPVPWVDIKIVSAEGGSAYGGDDSYKEMPQGQTGEIILKSWVLMKGYYKDEAGTSEVLRDGWFYTGDLGRLDEEGYLYILGRKKEVIKVSGELVHASEVESVIAKHPQVKEVAVVGVPDKLRGEVVKAVVSLKEKIGVSQEDIRYFAKQHLAHFKVPHTVEFRDALPKTRTGKIDKAQLH